MTAPPTRTREMTDAMMDAGQAYLNEKSLNGRFTLPGGFNWHEFWRVLLDASKPAKSLPSQTNGAEAVERPYWRDYPADQKVSPTLSFKGGCLTIKGQGYGDNDGAGTFAFKDDDLHWGHGEDEGYRYIHIDKSELEAIRRAIASAHGPYALAKPASDPAGDGVREARAKAIYEARFPEAGTRYGEKAWVDQDEAAKDVWRRCADVVLR